MCLVAAGAGVWPGRLEKEERARQVKAVLQPCPGAPCCLWGGRQWPGCAGEEPTAAASVAGSEEPVAAGEELVEKDRRNSLHCTNRVSQRSGSGCEGFLSILGPQENNLNSMKVLLVSVWKGDSG